MWNSILWIKKSVLIKLNNYKIAAVYSNIGGGIKLSMLYHRSSNVSKLDHKDNIGQVASQITLLQFLFDYCHSLQFQAMFCNRGG